MRSDNHSFLKIWKISNCWRHDVKRLMKMFVETTNTFLLHTPFAKTNELKIQTKHVALLFLSFFDFWKAKIRCLIFSYSNIFLVLLHSFNPNAKNIRLSNFLLFLSQIFYYLHLLLSTSSLVLRMSNPFVLLLFRLLFLQNTWGDALNWLHQSLLSRWYFWLIYGQVAQRHSCNFASKCLLPKSAASLSIFKTASHQGSWARKHIYTFKHLSKMKYMKITFILTSQLIIIKKELQSKVK